LLPRKRRALPHQPRLLRAFPHKELYIMILSALAVTSIIVAFSGLVLPLAACIKGN